MLQVHLLDTAEYVFSDRERTAIEDLARGAEAQARALLPALAAQVHLIVETGAAVIDVTGEVGFTASPTRIHWTVDPARGVLSVAQAHLGHMLLHEAHHAVRLQRFPSIYAADWYEASVMEGLATAFQRANSDYVAPWGQYPQDQIEQWAQELFAQPMDDRYQEWKFQHADGRRWIAYRVGTWVVDRAVHRSGRSAADLVWEPTASIVALAGLAGEAIGG